MPADLKIGDILAGGRRREVVSMNLAGVGAAEFTFEALPARGPDSWRELKAQYPAGPDDAAAGLAVDLEAFIPVAIAASCLTPSMTAAEAEQLIADVLNDGEFDLLWNACLEVNAGVNRPESSAASVPTARMRPKSKPRSGSGGRAASS